MKFEVKIRRCSDNDTSTTGELFVNGKFLCHTLELPWQNNRSYISSIPTGTYKGFLRYDKPDGWRIQFQNVPNRQGVQIHIGNYHTQIEGCVLVGLIVKNRENKLEDSSKAYQKFKTEFYGTTDPNQSPNLELEITVEYTNSATELKNEERKFTWYKQGKWSHLHTTAGKLEDRIELKRDTTHIYFQRDNNEPRNRFSRIELFGGKIELSDSANGPWTQGYGTFKRTN